MPRLSRRGQRLFRTFGLITALTALVAVAACSGTPTAGWHNPGDPVPSSRESSDAAVAANLTISPAGDLKSVSPADPVTATVTTGQITSVTLTNAQSKQVAGQLNADKTSWASTEKLGYNKTYTLTVNGAGADGTQFQQTRTFATVKPGNLTLPYMRANVTTLLDKGTFGVGQPITVWFDEPIKDKAAAEKTLVVTTDPAGIEGGWYWMDDHEVHWRPKVYWPSGTKVHVEANVYGKNLGGGLYGQEDRSADFTIGASHILVADAITKRMKVFVDGKQVMRINNKDVSAGIPISMGKGGTTTGANGVIVDFTTNSGVHVVTQKFEKYRMTSASFGITNKSDPNYYDTDIGKAIRISSDGEFVHLRTWDLYQLGNTNTSHGCVNVGPDFIYWIYDTFRAGDVVNVTGTNRKLDKRNGLGDWVVSWADWQKGSALA